MPSFRLEVGPGIRYYQTHVDGRLIGNIKPTRTFSLSDRWVDPLTTASMQFVIRRDLYATAVAEVGGFGTGDAPDITWQAYAKLGSQFNEACSVQAGYCSMTIEREIDERDSKLGLGGIMIGTRVSF